MAKETQLNKRLLRKVRNRIAEIPESYDQEVWYAPNGDAPCGTSACLAGETIIAAAPNAKIGASRLKRYYNLPSAGQTPFKFASRIPLRAMNLLGLTPAEAERVFDASGLDSLCVRWPEPFAARFAKAKTNKTRAKVAVAYLDECLKRGKMVW